MLSGKTPFWITAGGLLFTLTAGFINAVGFLGVHHHGLSHVTGQVTVVSIRLAEGDGPEALKGVLVGVWFFLGAVLSGVIIQRSELSRRGRRYGVAMMVEGTLLTVATGLLLEGNERGEYLAAMACGLQNAMVSSYSGAILRTTHMTGVVTDLGILIGHWLRRDRLEAQRVRLLLVLLGGFLTGGAVGAVSFSTLGAWSLSVPALTMIIAGTLFTIVSHRALQRERHQHTVTP